jgi:hypothetical protein
VVKYFRKKCNTCGAVFYCEGVNCSTPNSGYTICHCLSCSKDGTMWTLTCKKHNLTKKFKQMLAIEEL